MNEDPTQKLTDTRSFEERVLSELAMMRAEFRTELSTLNARLTTVENRLTTLEEKVDRRLQETRPIWENVQARLTVIEDTLVSIRAEMHEMNRDNLAIRGRLGRLEDQARSPAA